MGHYTAVIKGNDTEALSAAIDRGILPKAYKPLVLTKSRQSETLLVVNADDSAKLAAWLCEEPREAPYPIGACLVYSWHEATA